MMVPVPKQSDSKEQFNQHLKELHIYSHSSNLKSILIAWKGLLHSGNKLLF